jgi:uncharacterized iron-regulated protein
MCHFLKILVSCLLISAVLAGCSSDSGKHNINIPDIDKLDTYLVHNGQEPWQYVLDKFLNHKYVVLGEMHRIRHDVSFVSRIMSRLYHERQVRIIGLEFITSDKQELLDSLLDTQPFDLELANRILPVDWPYEDYRRILQNAGSLNRSLRENKQKIRLLALGKPIDYSILLDKELGMDIEQKMIWMDTVLLSRDQWMYDRLMKYASDKKALILVGTFHSLPRFKMRENNHPDSAEINRFTNILYDEYGDLVFSIVMHQPFLTINNQSGRLFSPIYPVSGIIDSVLTLCNCYPAGFDLVGSPFGELVDYISVYAATQPDVKLADLWDGYLYQYPFENFMTVKTIPNFYTKERTALYNLNMRAKSSIVGRTHVDMTPHALQQQMSKFVDKTFDDLVKPLQKEI